MAEESKQNNKRTIGQYVFGKTLGEGTFGKVKSAIHTRTGQPVAIKILQKSRIIDVADVQRVSRQIHILKLIRHPNIIQLYEIIETPKHLFLVMEYVMNGELFEYIVSNKRLDEGEACKIFQQLIAGIQYIHKLNIVHRDLKPQNLLLDFNHSLKIVDFGLSNTYGPGEVLQTACGSPCYASPQMIKGLKYQGLPTDIWSAGIILFAMVCGFLPFEDQDTPTLYEKIKLGKYRLPKHVSEDFKDILSKILEVDPSKRFTIDEMRNHRWWKLHSMPRNPVGVMVGYNRMPIDLQILSELKQLSYDPENAQKCIEANRHNSVTTSYYLLLKKHLKTGKQSTADIASLNFDESLLVPRKRRERIKTLQIESVDIEEITASQSINRKRYSSVPKKQTLSQIGRRSIGRNSAHNMQKTATETTPKKDINKDIVIGLDGYAGSKRYNNLLETRYPRTSINRTSVDKRDKQVSPTTNLIGNRYKQLYSRPLVSKSRDKSYSIDKPQDIPKRHAKSQISDKLDNIDFVKTNKYGQRLKTSEREHSRWNPNTCKNSTKRYQYFYY